MDLFAFEKDCLEVNGSSVLGLRTAIIAKEQHIRRIAYEKS